MERFGGQTCQEADSSGHDWAVDEKTLASHQQDLGQNQDDFHELQLRCEGCPGLTQVMRGHLLCLGTQRRWGDCRPPEVPSTMATRGPAVPMLVSPE